VTTDIFQLRLFYGAFRAGWLATIYPSVMDVDDERRCGEAFVKWLDPDEREPLFRITREVTHQAGWPWTDPRTGVTYPPPEKKQ
jgi:hypothetical protein